MLFIFYYQFHKEININSCGYLAVGGQKSELTVQALKENRYTIICQYLEKKKKKKRKRIKTERNNLNIKRASQIEVGGSINNSLNISNHCGEDRLLVSNNDERIKVYSLPSLTHVTNIRVPVAVNYGSFYLFILSFVCFFLFIYFFLLIFFFFLIIKQKLFF